MTKLLEKNKGKLLFSALLVLAVFSVVTFARNRTEAEQKEDPKKVVAVSIKTADKLTTFSSLIKYPATVVGDQEARVTASVSGTASAVSFDLGDKVGVGKMLVKIDEQGSTQSAGDSGFRSGQIRSLELAVKQANDSYALARDTYKRDSSNANETAKDIARAQLDSAQAALDSAIAGHSVSAPIAGTVTLRGVSVGDSISPGQLLATISRTDKLKVQFYVGKDELGGIKLNDAITIKNDDKELAAKVINISPAADSATRKFLIEAIPEQKNDLSAGMVVDVSFSIKEVPSSGGSIILPLSAINISPNGKSIFILDGDTAKKVPVEILKVSGENAEISADIAPDAKIIVEGNKLVSEGERVEVK